ncbi:MAG: hypothetical protein K6C08_01515 [Oscillospiraceae bacterium]|nr:hypothetical protein [Oscillospiraceae bacterium]
MKKAAKKLFVVACLGCCAFVLGKLLKKDSVQEKLFAVLGEDTYISLVDTAHLLGDLLMWPVDFIHALLP